MFIFLLYQMATEIRLLLDLIISHIITWSLCDLFRVSSVQCMDSSDTAAVKNVYMSEAPGVKLVPIVTAISYNTISSESV